MVFSVLVYLRVFAIGSWLKSRLVLFYAQRIAPPFTIPEFTTSAAPTAVGAVPIDISTSVQSSGIR